MVEKSLLSDGARRRVQAPSPASRHEFWWSVFLVMCLIQYTGCWLYPAAGGFGMLEAISPEKKFGAQFQLLLWAAIAGGALLHVMKSGFDKLFHVLKVFFPFWSIGLLAALFGFDPFTSLRYFTLWTLALVAAAMVGSELTPERGIKVLGYALLFLMLGSVVMALLVPSIGAQVYGSGTVWRGLFTNKNQLGWVAALSLVISVVLVRRLGVKLSVLTGLAACACLLMSGSKGALVAALVTLGFTYLLGMLASRVTVGFGIAVILFVFLVAGVFGLLVLPNVLELLGRDMTLTGRTDVWSVFFHSISRSIWFGEGPGAFTAVSPLTVPLAAKLQSLGAIVTPHNIYLGVLGDSGLFGLVGFLGLLFYITFVVPLSSQKSLALTTSAVGFLMMAHGMVETHEVFSPGIGWFLLALGRALTLRDAGAAAATQAVPARVAAPSRTKLGNRLI